MSFMKYGDGKIESVYLDEKELSDEQKKVLKDSSKKRIKKPNDNSELKDETMGDN